MCLDRGFAAKGLGCGVEALGDKVAITKNVRALKPRVQSEC